MSELTRMVFTLSIVFIKFRQKFQGCSLGYFSNVIGSRNLGNKSLIGSGKGVNTLVHHFLLLPSFLFLRKFNSRVTLLFGTWNYFLLMLFKDFAWLGIEFAEIEDFPSSDAIVYSMACLNDCRKISCSYFNKMFIKRGCWSRLKCGN